MPQFTLELKPAWLHTNPKIVKGCSTYRKTSLQSKSAYINLNFSDFVSPCYCESREYCIWRFGQNNYNKSHMHDSRSVSSKLNIKNLKNYSKYIDTSFSAMAHASEIYDNTHGVNDINDINDINDVACKYTNIPLHENESVLTNTYNDSNDDSVCEYSI